MGHDFIAVSQVELSDLPNNAEPYAECMYRCNGYTYYEYTRGNVTMYYKALNNSFTDMWSVNVAGAEALREALLNQSIDISALFTVASHSATNLAPLLRELRAVERSTLPNDIANNFASLLRVVRHACDDGILLSV